jgi:hypothetical protein
MTFAEFRHEANNQENDSNPYIEAGILKHDNEQRPPILFSLERFTIHLDFPDSGYCAVVFRLYIV